PSIRTLVNLFPPLLILAGASNSVASTFAQTILAILSVIIAALSLEHGLSPRNLSLVGLMGLLFVYFSLRVDNSSSLNDLIYVGLCFFISSLVLLSRKQHDMSLNRTVAISTVIIAMVIYIAYPAAFKNNNYLAAAIGCISIPASLRSRASRRMYLTLLAI